MTERNRGSARATGRTSIAVDSVAIQLRKVEPAASIWIRLPAITDTCSGFSNTSILRLVYEGGVTLTVSVADVSSSGRSDETAAIRDLIDPAPMLPITPQPISTAAATAIGCDSGTTRFASTSRMRSAACRVISSRISGRIGRGLSSSSAAVTTRLSSAPNRLSISRAASTPDNGVARTNITTAAIAAAIAATPSELRTIAAANTAPATAAISAIDRTRQRMRTRAISADREGSGNARLLWAIGRFPGRRRRPAHPRLERQEHERQSPHPAAITFVGERRIRRGRAGRSRPRRELLGADRDRVFQIGR